MKWIVLGYNSMLLCFFIFFCLSVLPVEASESKFTSEFKGDHLIGGTVTGFAMTAVTRKLGKDDSKVIPFAFGLFPWVFKETIDYLAYDHFGWDDLAMSAVGVGLGIYVGDKVFVIPQKRGVSLAFNW